MLTNMKAVWVTKDGLEASGDLIRWLLEKYELYRANLGRGFAESHQVVDFISWLNTWEEENVTKAT